MVRKLQISMAAKLQVEFSNDFIEVCFLGCSSWDFMTGIDNDSVLVRQQAIIWTNEEPVKWHIYIQYKGVMS